MRFRFSPRLLVCGFHQFYQSAIASGFISAATNKCIFMVDEVAEAMTILKEYKPVTIHKQGDLEAADWTLRSSDNISNEIEKK